MPLKLLSFRISATGLAAGIAAGVAAALLSMLTPQRPPATLLLGFLSPLPLMIAALAFGAIPGALAAAIGTAFVVVFDMKLGHLVLADNPSGSAAFSDGAVFFVGLGLPACLLTLLVRAPPKPLRAIGLPRMRPDELRLSRIVIAGAVFAMAAVGLVLTLDIVEHGSLSAFQLATVAKYEELLRLAVVKGQTTLAEADLHRTALLTAALTPWLQTMFVVVFYLVNLWLAAKVARLSGGLGVEWPDIPLNFRLPRAAALLLAVFLGLSFTTGLLGLASHVVGAALVAIFSLQGLAVIHAVTRGRTWRLPALVFTYGLVPFVFWGLLGLLDTAFSFRDRQKPVIRKQPERNKPWK